jgi:hypothetical protein
VVVSVFVVGSSLIYVAIVVMWACLLIPMWLRRHDQETEVRSVDRFSQAMRILSRRTPPSADSRYLVMPRRPSAGPVPDLIADPGVPGVTSDPREDRATVSAVLARATAPTAAVRRRLSGHLESRRSVRSTAPSPRSGRQRLIARRRRMLVGLFGLTALLFVLAVAGVVSWWWQGVADLALLALVTHLRAEAKRASELERRRRRAVRARRGAGGPAREAAAFAPSYAAVDEPGLATSATFAGSAAAAETMVIDEDTWEPVPVPVPTYVTAPVAEYVAQSDERPIIDLTRPGAWSDSQVGAFLEDDDEDLFDQMVADDAGLDVIVERRRAVND